MCKESLHAFGCRLDDRARSRNSGVDLLRLVSMLFVVGVHVMNTSWLDKLETGAGLTVSSATCFLIQTVCYCCVDIFALISGYVAYTDTKKPVRLAGYLQLYLQVAAYGLLVPAVFLLVRPQLVSARDFLLALFPVTSDRYWYFSAYTGLFLLIPLLNEALRHTSKRTLRVLGLAIFLVFGAYSVLVDRFKISDGYSFIWLALLYCLGGILKKCAVGERLKPRTAVALALALSLCGWAWRVTGPELSLFGVHVTRLTLQKYTSPTVLGAAILYVLAFSKLRFGKQMNRLIAYAAPCAFAVYLLNTHPLFFRNVMENRFAFLATASPLVIVGITLAFSVGFVAASVLIDRLRLRLFDLLHIPQMLAALDRAVHNAVGKYIPGD